eukprot:762637-Hanusia_phi.AAC.6
MNNTDAPVSYHTAYSFAERDDVKLVVGSLPSSSVPPTICRQIQPWGSKEYRRRSTQGYWTENLKEF